MALLVLLGIDGIRPDIAETTPNLLKASPDAVETSPKLVEPAKGCPKHQQI